MEDNPYKPSAEPQESEPKPASEDISSAHAAYNIVSDSIIGPNVRMRDNILQALFILVSAVLLAAVGAVLAALNPRWDLPWYGGALFGAVAGVVFGVFASGIFLMIYRAVRHIPGKHK